MIKLSKLNKVYKTGKNSFHALKDLDLNIEKGEFIAILGKSGSGKSTLLNIIGLLDDFDDGEYILNDLDESRTDKIKTGKGQTDISQIDIGKISENKKADLRNREIGVVLQDYSLINHKSVLFNVMLPMYFNKKCRYSRMKRKAMDMLESMGIEDQAKKKAVNLSGGQRQRVAIARAMINEPQIILADEPTGALDSKTATEIMDAFTKLNEKGVTVIIVTHDLDVANRCNRIIELMDGTIVKDEADSSSAQGISAS